MTQDSGGYPPSTPGGTGSYEPETTSYGTGPTPYGTGSTSYGAGSTETGSTTEVAKEEAKGVGTSVKEAGGHVTQTATDQAREVAAEARQQARDLMAEGRHQVREQARTGQQKAADGLGALADELREMANRGGQSGIATEVARQAADRVQDWAAWLQKREPGDLLTELRSWARQRPGTFLLGAALAGVVAGRLTGGAIAAQRQGSDTTTMDTGYAGDAALVSGEELPGGYPPTPDEAPVYGSSYGTVPAPPGTTMPRYGDDVPPVGTPPAGGPPSYPTGTAGPAGGMGADPTGGLGTADPTDPYREGSERDEPGYSSGYGSGGVTR